MNSPEASWVAQRRDSYPGCQPLKDTRAWASSLKMDPAGLEGGPCDAPCDEPLIQAAWNLSGGVSYQEPAAGQQRPGEYGFCASDGGDQAEEKNPSPLISDTLSSLLCWRGAVIVYVKVTVQTKDSNKLLSLLYW
ncbi:PREDICTED: putative protein ATP11AUN [Cercocebus atys]|uniref:putative protein ATP11AUN n=1 Tax=Cercocebus atys TaxID=9531 RepID=UPI0005F39974|nr:PREDICTED: putative protein ATP11AUN [Cercocebus atys]